MRIDFSKYQATGNDFIIIDNRSGAYDYLLSKQIKFLCDRRFGVGADGLMLLNNHIEYDFEMKYYNADGHEGTMCGNGARCLVKFANGTGLIRKNYTFLAVDGMYNASIENNGTISVRMHDVEKVEYHNGHYILNTGSPHFVCLT
ncbi:MAG: diaminopimelate epimerase, partial [Chitinophagaceae bacterium]|nr:diaminopimelate epimerase [Chitinophagaceae bacterium]